MSCASTAVGGHSPRSAWNFPWPDSCLPLFFDTAPVLSSDRGMPQNPRGGPFLLHPVLVSHFADSPFIDHLVINMFYSCSLLTTKITRIPVLIWVFQITVHLIYVSGVRYNTHHTVCLSSLAVAGCLPTGSTAQWFIVMSCQHIIYLIDTLMLSP